MKYIIFESGGKQYKASEGDVLELERIESADKTFNPTNVLLYVADNVCKIGAPYLLDVLVKASILSDTRGEKIRVSKFKSKVRYRRVMGHRQSLTQIKINTISVKEK